MAPTVAVPTVLALDPTLQTIHDHPAPLALGTITQITPSPTTSAGLPEHVLRDAREHILRFGNDDGIAFIHVANDRYIVYTCSGCDATPDGLYAFDRTTKATIPIGRGTDALLTDEWVLYMGRHDTAKTLEVFNLRTGEHLQVAAAFDPRDLRGDYLTNPSERYSLAPPTIVWVYGGVHVYDLNTRTTRTLNIPQQLWSSASVLGHSETLIWFSGRWGYDLITDQVFFIRDFDPPGWERVRSEGGSGPRLEDDQFIWSYEVNGEEYIFTAPIVRSGQ
ncbi:hypothetical protein HC928_03910 [bacterium]|nr:hypothetical protein [bacterium]